MTDHVPPRRPLRPEPLAEIADNRQAALRSHAAGDPFGANLHALLYVGDQIARVADHLAPAVHVADDISLTVGQDKSPEDLAGAVDRVARIARLRARMGW
ncbi:Uncharacterised protein [Mycobacteroides abscessus subsp. abscessus]|nr:Uncharacterised protein [Mycobacteroides abscessus subsp. abscessus]